MRDSSTVVSLLTALQVEQLKKEKGPECITIPASPLKGTSTVDALRHLYAHFTGLTITPVDGDADMLEPNEVCYEFKQKGSLGSKLSRLVHVRMLNGV